MDFDVDPVSTSGTLDVDVSVDVVPVGGYADGSRPSRSYNAGSMRRIVR